MNSRIGRRKSDIWRYRLNQALTVLTVSLIMILSLGCEAFRTFLHTLV